MFFFCVFAFFGFAKKRKKQWGFVKKNKKNKNPRDPQGSLGDPWGIPGGSLGDPWGIPGGSPGETKIAQNGVPKNGRFWGPRGPHKRNITGKRAKKTQKKQKNAQKPNWGKLAIPIFFHVSADSTSNSAEIAKSDKMCAKKMGFCEKPGHFVAWTARRVRRIYRLNTGGCAAERKRKKEK